ncbi:hypothetical protein BsWGS_06661 [Bradybaena similaris]
MTITAKDKGQPGSRKRKLSDADIKSEEVEEETTVVAAGETVAKKKKKKKGKKAQQITNPHVEGDKGDEDEGSSSGISTQRLKETSKSGSGSAPGASKDVDRRDERDRRTLFLKDLPGKCTVRHIKALSKDIKQVRLKFIFALINKKRQRIGFAYATFASEEAAENNFKKIDGAVIKGSKITVDYVGSKSKLKSDKPKKKPGEIDPLRLYVSGLPGNTREADILKLFPEAVDIELPMRQKDKMLFGYGFITFNDADVTAAYHDKSQDLTFQGRKLVVLYAKKRNSGSKNSEKRKQKQKGAKSAAKQKFDTAGDVEQDDDDNEDDDDGEGMEEDDDE